VAHQVVHGPDLLVGDRFGGERVGRARGTEQQVLSYGVEDDLVGGRWGGHTTGPV
jgi:hypothetical protein